MNDWQECTFLARNVVVTEVTTASRSHRRILSNGTKTDR
jgi:hypothetical protein